MKVLVLGGTGLIGRAVVSALRARGHDVTALARSDEAAVKLAALGARPLAGDIRTPVPWLASAAFADIGAIIHTAATFMPDMGAVDRALIEAILAAADRDRATKRRRFIYTGGCWLYGNTGDRIADEKTPFEPLEDFAWMIKNYGQLAESEHFESAIIHPAMVYERGGGVFARFVDDATLFGRVRIVGSEDVRWPLVHSDDLGELYALALEHGRPGEAYNAAAFTGVRVGEIARAIARRKGAPETPFIRTVEDAIAEIGSWARGFAIDQQMSGAKARRELGWTPRHTDLAADIS